MRISGYRLMWLMVMFDLPVETKSNRRDYRRFVDKLEDYGYGRLQYSIYVRPCATEENTTAHFERIVGHLPPEGEVRILKFTDKQWARMTLFRERRRVGVEVPPEQFTFFDDDGEICISPLADEEVRHRESVEFAESSGPGGGTAYVAEPPRPTYGVKPKQRKKHGAKPTENPSFEFFD